MTIAWRSFIRTQGAVVYWSDGGAAHTVAEASVTMAHAILLEGLEPATTYFYQVLQDEKPVGEVHSFSTASEEFGAALRFAVLGDHGCGCTAQYSLIDVIKDREPDLVLTTGDNAYYTGSETEVLQNYFVPLASLMDHVPVYPCLGNHDVMTENGRPLLDSVYLPTNEADGTERFYSFDRGDCHFIALDSNQDLSEESLQYEWLEDDLQRAGATWIICYFHHPIYSDSSHGDALWLQCILPPLFDRYGVDLVLSGHDHNYQRTYPIRGLENRLGCISPPMGCWETADAAMEPSYLSPNGTIYVVTGGGGWSLYPIWQCPLRLAAGEERFHTVIVDVAGGELTLSAVDKEGVVFDTMSITKTLPIGGEGD